MAAERPFVSSSESPPSSKPSSSSSFRRLDGFSPPGLTRSHWEIETETNEYYNFVYIHKFLYIHIYIYTIYIYVYINAITTTTTTAKEVDDLTLDDTEHRVIPRLNEWVKGSSRNSQL